jgi:hypothetical protein
MAGFSIWLLSGEPAPGAFVALVVAVAAAILSTRTQAGAGRYYLIGGPSVVALLLLMKLGGGRTGPTAWHDLQAEFASNRRPPAMERRPQVHLIRRTSEFMIRPYRYRRVFVALGRDGVDLRPSWPQTLVYRSLHIPLQRLTGCRTGDSMFAGHTLLAIQYPTVDIGLADGDGRVLAWCRENGVGGEVFEPDVGLR